MFGRPAYRGSGSSTVDLGGGKIVNSHMTEVDFQRGDLMVVVNVGVGGDIPAGLTATDRILGSLRALP